MRQSTILIFLLPLIFLGGCTWLEETYESVTGSSAPGFLSGGDTVEEIRPSELWLAVEERSIEYFDLYMDEEYYTMYKEFTSDLHQDKVSFSNFEKINLKGTRMTLLSYVLEGIEVDEEAGRAVTLASVFQTRTLAMGVSIEDVSSYRLEWNIEGDDIVLAFNPDDYVIDISGTSFYLLED